MFNYLGSFLKSKLKSIYILSDDEFEEWKKEAYPLAIKKRNKAITDFGNTYCPIAKTNCLLSGCLHYKDASVWFVNGSDFLKMHPEWGIEKPKCKLWGKNDGSD